MIDLTEYIASLERQIERSRSSLAPLEAGQMHLQHKEGDGPWVDTTQQWIQRHRENIAELEAIVAALKRRQNP